VQLEKAKIKVIPVALGSESDPKEILTTTANKQNLIIARDDEKPKDLGDKIMEVVIKGIDDMCKTLSWSDGKCHSGLICCSICARR